MCKNLELFTRKVFSTSKPDFSHQLHRGEKEADVKVYQTSNLHYYSKKNVQQDKLNAYTPPKNSEKFLIQCRQFKETYNWSIKICWQIAHSIPCWPITFIFLTTFSVPSVESIYDLQGSTLQLLINNIFAGSYIMINNWISSCYSLTYKITFKTLQICSYYLAKTYSSRCQFGEF